MKQLVFKTFCKLALFTFLLTGAGTVSNLDANPSGIWVASGNQGVCPQDRTCAEWDVDGVVQMGCCIPHEFVNTSNFGACDSGLRN
ncbi:MAG: hypothetical protein AAGF23_26800 [Acidobacteriota bacterium]